METYLKPEAVNLPRLNNKEYLNMMQRIVALLVLEDVITKLGVADILTLMKNLLAELEDLVNRSMANIETEEMNEVDVERDGLINYLFSQIRSAKNSPIKSHREAYNRLKLLLRAYKGLARMRNMEETAAIRGLLLDLSKETAAADVVTLNLTEAINALKAANEHYATLTETRANERIAEQLSTSKDIRAQLAPLYDNLVTRIMAVNIVTPCEEAESFLKHHNQIITETDNAYAMRATSATGKSGSSDVKE